MAASFCASFMIFLLTGGYSIYFGLGFTQDALIKAYVSVALMANAVFYHYMAAYTEMDPGMRRALSQERWLEWVVRVVNQCILLSLWFWLDHGWAKFGTALICLYVSFLAWDVLTWTRLTKHTMFKLDLVGTVLSLFYVKAGYVVLGETTIDVEWIKSFYTFFGTLSLAFIALPLIGMYVLRFNPLGKDYMTRPSLH